MRSGFPFIPFFALVAAFAPTGGLAASREWALSLRDSVERALAHNFDLRIERESGVAAGGQLDSARGAYVPDISVAATAAHDEAATTSSGVAETDSQALSVAVSGLTRTGATYRISTDLASRRQQTLLGASATARSGELTLLEITQPLLKNRAIDASRLALEQGRLDVSLSAAALAQRAMEVVYAVEFAYSDLVAARETVRVREQSLALARQTLADTEARLSIGTVAPLDARSARSEAAAREADLITARQQVREKQNALLLLFTDDYAAYRETELITTDALADEAVPLDYETSARRALADRPELAQLDLTLDRSRLSTAYAKNQRLPALDLGASVGLNGAGSGFGGVTSDLTGADHPSYGVGLTLTLPWSDRGANGRVVSARAAERQAELGLARRRQLILAEVDDALTAAQAAWEKISATRLAREYAESAFAAGLERLSVGGTTAYQVLQLQRDLASARGEEISARADYSQALAALRLREASTLDHWNIAPEAAARGAADPGRASS